ncbi:MAG: DUF6288 domain-containing protein [Phycisphaerae bacterium]|nr:DUF6288 domain-containing protein [Phycisphaerae bacterium]
MKRFILGIVLLLAFLKPVSAKIYEMNPDMKARAAYPTFSVGVTGLKVSIEKGLVVTVQGEVPGSPAVGKCTKGDVITGVNGKSFSGNDPLVMLGEAIGSAEATDGIMAFTLKSGKKVNITIPILGDYRGTWPVNCKKSEQIIEGARRQVLSSGVLDKDGITDLIAGIFMLSTGRQDDLAAVKPMVMRVAAKPTVGAGSNWPRGYQGILMAEYYLRTGDRSVLPGLKKLCDGAVDSQYIGGWAHGGLAKDQSMGYVQGGMMNPAGAPLLTALILAKECGVDVQEPLFSSALHFFYRFVGHAAVPYGDHRPEGWMSCNGKNGMLAAGLHLLPNDPYRSAGQLLAMDMADSYRWVRAGHTGGGFDVIWRSMTAHLVPREKVNHYRIHMKRLAWYYDLSRQPGGGFSMVGEERYKDTTWGVGMALAYTAPLGKLRITGGAPTEFSKKVAVPVRPWGNAIDDLFTSTDHCRGFGKEKLETHEIYKAIDQDGDKDVCVKMLKHYNPVVRAIAAKKLAQLGAVKQLQHALAHPDPRVRRSVCEGISNDNGFFRGLDGRSKGFLAPQVVSDAFVPYFVKTLKAPNVALWETDGVLYAFSKAKPEDIRRNLDLIKPWLTHEDWYLRESAFYAMLGLRETIKPKELFMMAEVFANEMHSKPQINYAGAFSYLFKKLKVKLAPEDMNRFARIIASQISDPKIPGEMGEPAKQQCAFKAGMALKGMDKSVYASLQNEYARYFKNWTLTQHSGWMITGSKWTDPMDVVLGAMGEDGNVLCQALKAVLQDIDSGKISLGKRPNKDVVPALKKAIGEYEKKYGAVKARYFR